MYYFNGEEKSYMPLVNEDGTISVRIVGGGTGGSSMEFIFGTNEPTADMGADGDLYMNNADGNLYKKEDDTWSLKGNLKGAKGDKGDKGDRGNAGEKGDKGDKGDTGATGSAGATWLFGAVAPTSTQGKNGDQYLNTANFDVYNKANNAWTKQGNIKGAKGDKGDTGASGFGTQAQYNDIIARLEALENPEAPTE